MLMKKDSQVDKKEEPQEEEKNDAVDAPEKDSSKAD